MKQANNNPVDLLLRAIAKREREQSRAGERDVFTDGGPGSQLDSEHLDADELNLYAEGVLPPPTRARYAAHLADCGSCRSIVVTLAQASGAGTRYETVDQQSGVRWWHGIGALLSLPVLRYALPALVLTGLIAIGLIALREQRSTELVARNETAPVSEPAVPSASLNEPSRSASPAFGLKDVSPPTAIEKRGEVPSANTSEIAPKNNPVENKGLLDEVRDTSTAAKPAAPALAKDAQQYPDAAGAPSSQPGYAPGPPPPAKPVGELHAKSIARKDEPFEREARRREEDNFKVQSKDDSETHGPARSRPQSVGGRLETSVTTENRVSSIKDKKEAAEKVETRSVSGRRFRRQGNAWIDTAYESSRSTTNISRGSERFRVLVGDEPGLRTIVQQLGGEVVVIWKNKAYRIR